MVTVKRFISSINAMSIQDNPWRSRCLLVGYTLSLLAVSADMILAHKDSPASPPLVPHPLWLQHRTPAEIIALFARERFPDLPGDRLPRAARTDAAESLLPYGVDAVLRGEDADQVVLVGTGGVSDVQNCIRVIDAPIEKTGADRERIVLTLRHADAHRVRAAVLRLPEAGSVSIQDRQLTLEGPRAWLHRALRQVIRAELNEPETVGLPTR
jgi:hypothetical protein